MTIAETVQLWLDSSQAKIIANYNRDNMRASGSFEKSLRNEIKETPGRLIATMVGAHHSLFVDRGRGKTNSSTKGAITLRESIEQWIKDKRITPYDGISTKSLAFLIARKIHREGWKPKNTYPNGVISSVINQAEIDKFLISLSKVTATNIRSEVWQTLA
jgi:hypothetical protein